MDTFPGPRPKDMGLMPLDSFPPLKLGHRSAHDLALTNMDSSMLKGWNNKVDGTWVPEFLQGA